LKRLYLLDQPASGQVGAFVEGALNLGLPICPDQNVPNPYGICPSVYNIRDGLRQSTTVAYLDPSRSRPNLTIVPNALVAGLELRGKKVRGVRLEKDGSHHTVFGDETVLSAGAYHTPQILMLSGIGPAAELERLGIQVVHTLPGVGQNYQDHAGITMTFEGVSERPEIWETTGLRLFIKSDPAREYLDFHVTMRAPTILEGFKHMVSFTAYLLEQRNRGSVYLKNADPHELPGVDPQMLEDPGDIEAALAAMKFIQKLANSESMKQFCGALLVPSSEDDWGKFARSSYTSYHHGSGTCKMGSSSDPMAVVDERLRVHGIANLWIADCSILPTVTHANTNLTAIMIGERAADFIRGQL
jgi:choline dehydrogenase